MMPATLLYIATQLISIGVILEMDQMHKAPQCKASGQPL